MESKIAKLIKWRGERRLPGTRGTNSEKVIKRHISVKQNVDVLETHTIAM